ncbi:MAG: CDP-alcohol phosphatidyltransferase family protein [Phycisphaerae bacterium]|jgi:CDP-diacylglycerol--glycerol-3-phosphate 3-phosphatidyltransferase|nr:CDP-alcohol phosphatidyltransferase family protein [Phycisphaerae bacterium]
MNWKLPNQLTVGRMVLSIAFFVLLGVYEQGASCGRCLLNIAFGLYIVAGITDVLDGYLARKWNITSAFGRILDPVMDKILVVGAFIMLTGPNFAMTPGAVDEKLPGWITGGMISSVQAWMVVVILGREFLVSGVRGYSESQGMKFPATPAGKIKMFVQSFAICTSLYQQANVPTAMWAIYMKVVCVWLAVIVTLLSGLSYLNKARGLLLGGDE